MVWGVSSIKVLGTSHRVQGWPFFRNSLDDPGFAAHLKQLITEEAVDFIFEEASGFSPTPAKKLADALGVHYLDIDPNPAVRGECGIVDADGLPFPVVGITNEKMVEEHAEREKVWLRQIAGTGFKSGIVICGVLHTISVALKLRTAGFRVTYDSYMPHSVLCDHKQPSKP